MTRRIVNSSHNKRGTMGLAISTDRAGSAFTVCLSVYVIAAAGFAKLQTFRHLFTPEGSARMKVCDTKCPGTSRIVYTSWWRSDAHPTQLGTVIFSQRLRFQIFEICPHKNIASSPKKLRAPKNYDVTSAILCSRHTSVYCSTVRARRQETRTVYSQEIEPNYTY